MNKKTVLFASTILGCMILLVGSYIQWNKKVSSAGVQSPSSTLEDLEDETINKEKNDEKKEKNDTPTEPKQDDGRLLSLAANADQKVQTVIQTRQASGEPLDFLIIGSTVMEKGGPGYAERLKTALDDAYGDFINVTVKSFDITSNTFMDNLSTHLDLDTGYDIILFEPFNLKNNGVLTADDQQEYINLFYDRIKEKVDDAVLVLQPSQPLHNATFYPLEVGSIQKFAESNTIPYINHWTEWPASDSDDLPNFLDEDSVPNTAGAEVWANALINYFIAQ